MLVNASTWSLMLTGKLIDPDEEARTDLGGFIRRLAGRLCGAIGVNPVAASWRHGNALGMCLGIPARLVELDDDTRVGTAEVAGVRRSVSLALCPEADRGDWVLVHVGFALARIDEDEALRTLELLQELGAG